MAKIQITLKDETVTIRRELPTVLKKALLQVGMQAERYAKESLRNQDAVDTGLLRNSVTFAIAGETPHTTSYKSKKTKGKAQTSGSYSGTAPTDSSRDQLSLYIGTNVEYGRYIEYGTVKMRPRPFIKPAALEHGSEYQQMVKDTMQNG